MNKYLFFLLVVIFTTIVPGWAGFNLKKTSHQHESKAVGVCSDLFPDEYYDKDCFDLAGRCYCQLFANYYYMTWEEMERKCQEENMTLLSIETPEEDKLIYDYFQKHHDSLYQQEYYLTAGKYSEINQRWEWNPNWRDPVESNGTTPSTTTISPPTPGTPMTYSNWYPGQPSNVEDGNHCLGLMFYYGIPYEGGYWDDIDCNYGDNNYYNKNIICESNQ